MSENPTKTRFVLDAAVVALRNVTGASGVYHFRNVMHIRDGVAVAADGFRAMRCQLRSIPIQTEDSQHQMPNIALYGGKELRRAVKANDYLEVRFAQSDDRPFRGQHAMTVVADGSGNEWRYRLPGLNDPDPLAIAFVDKINETIDGATAPEDAVAIIHLDPYLLKGIIDAFVKAEQTAMPFGSRAVAMKMTIHGPIDPIGFAMELSPGRVMDAALMPIDPEMKPQ